MAKSKPYNGHKNWNHWNVALWLGNDEGLYNFARELKRKLGTRKAAEAFLANMADLQYHNKSGRPTTPDGAPYTITALRAAIAGL